MIKLQITAFIAVFFMTASMMVLPVQTEQELQRKRQDYTARLLMLKEEQADLEVKRMRDIMDSKGYNPMDAVVLEPQNE